MWQLSHPIEGAFESLAILQKLGKTIYLVTNNTEHADQTYCDRARCASLYLNPVSMQYMFSFLHFIRSDNYFVRVYDIYTN